MQISGGGGGGGDELAAHRASLSGTLPPRPDVSNLVFYAQSAITVISGRPRRKDVVNRCLVKNNNNNNNSSNNNNNNNSNNNNNNPHNLHNL